MNAGIAEKLREAAMLLQAQGAEPFRARAFLLAAQSVDGLGEDVGEILEREGPAGLERLPHVGRGIAAAIAEMALTGRWTRLDRLRGELDPVRLFCTVPGIGRTLAARIHDTLDVDTLEALESAAHDGRLETVPGVGRRRASMLRAALALMLGRVRGARRGVSAGAPPVALLLDVDREYRERGAAGDLPRIAPRRFNPSGERWLPVLHTTRGSRHFSALFSNTALAHQLGRTDDWVVIYDYDEDHHEGLSTVVTEPRGELRGRRVVRGRERECLEHYRAAGG